MAHAGLSPRASAWAIDWQAPWFKPWAPLGQPVQAAVRSGSSVAESLNHAAQRLGLSDLCFVSQSELPKGQAYEAFIHAQQRIPSRDNLHDFFNGLCWLRFGRSKRRLNQLQAQEIARQGVGQQRGALRDALTVFDENALLLQLPDALWQALCERDWHRLFVHQRHLWAQAQVQVFGHALMEKLVQPYLAITAHAWRVWPSPTPASDAAPTDALLDHWLCHSLQEDLLRRKAFAPLPVLGLPGWWAANESPAFYGQTQVFRAAATALTDKSD